MKFRAVISDGINIKEFLNVITTFSRMEKNLIINVQPKKLLLQIESEAYDGQYLWCDIDASLREGFFSEYIMDGIDNEHNQIYMICLASSFLRALSYVRNNAVDYIKLKLIKTHMPCLAVEMSATISNDQDVLTPKIQHAIPITVVPRNEWNQYEIPLEVEYDLSIAMPSAKSLRMLLDKKKNLAPTVTLYATLSDELSLVVETEVVTVASHYRNLKCAPARKTTDQQPHEQLTNLSEASCRVDTKKLAALFETINFYDMVMTANIRHEQALNIRFDMRQNAFVNYILPATNFE
ncbi:checkpoint protein HUS1 [Anopheles marshallii]|uniref:checkpoint protein HUS1 n=1 Tax=Anopheles marshallii TaxID=1521116 RepID=UPI00237BDF41|nr:checkpoint protein HUS1 [Anopheles marshallii]